MNFNQFLQLVDNNFHSASYKGQLRYGQYVMNELYNVWPEKYAQITGSDYDCFYDNSIAKLTLEKLEKEWQSEICKSQQKRLEALQRLSDLDQELGLE